MNNPTNDEHCKDCCTACGPRWGADFGKKILWTLVGVLLVYLIFMVGTVTRNKLREFYTIGQADQAERMITVTGYGKVTGENNIAVTSIGYSNVDANVANAQKTNKTVMDKVFADLKALGVAEKDLQSNYSIYPEYNYTQDKGQQLTGYRVSNTVNIKIRDLSKIPDVLNLAGKYGANQVNGLSFTIDDPESLKAEARGKALQDAQRKAQLLARQLGVSLVSVVSYNEYEGGISPLPMMYDLKGQATGMGGGGAPEQLAGGSQDVTVNASITYQISSH